MNGTEERFLPVESSEGENMERILEMLCSGEYVSGEEMSRKLGMTRAAVWKKIEQLRSEGWGIESGGKRGYRLDAGDRIDPVLWTDRLTTKELGKGEIRYALTLDSTNRQVKQMAVAGAPNGSLALCEEQTAGRGRLGRTWVSSPGVGLWHSLLLRPRLSPEYAPLVTFACAMAMARALERLQVGSVMIKWPNDLIFHGKKICGILNEVSCDMDQIEYLVLGVGLNVKNGSVPEELKDKAGCLEDYCMPPRRRVILAAYLDEMERIMYALEEKGYAAIEAGYREKSCTLGNRVQVIGSETFEGTAKDMDSSGALLVEDDLGKVHRVLAGDVSVRGVMGYV